jgi:hypothetical protein
MIRLKDVLAGKDLINEGRNLQDNFQRLYLKETLSTDLYSYIKLSPQDKFIEACQRYGYTALMRWFATENGYTPQDMNDIKSYRTAEGLMNDNPELFEFAVKWHTKQIAAHQTSVNSKYKKFIMQVGSAKGVASWLNFSKVESPKSGWLVRMSNTSAAEHAFKTGEITGMQPDMTRIDSGGSFGGGINMSGKMSGTGGGYGISYLPEEVKSFDSLGCVIVFQAEYVRAYDVNTKQSVCIFDSGTAQMIIPIYDTQGKASIYGKSGSPLFQGSLNAAIKKAIQNSSNYNQVGVKKLYKSVSKSWSGPGHPETSDRHIPRAARKAFASDPKNWASGEIPDKTW